MKLYQIRKGQFVYYNNELHRIYGVKQMYKQSVHAIRLRDLTQVLTTAASVEKYRPKEHDSFVFNRNVYTLNKRNAEEGDQILIHNPKPDPLDTYSLNEIDVVESSDKNGVTTSNSHGLKHYEYLVMEPGRADGSNPIDYHSMEHVAAENLDDSALLPVNTAGSVHLPRVGSIYRKKDDNELLEAMVIAIKGQTIYMGGGLEVLLDELTDTEKWEVVYHLLDM
ncbi:hypothetical protein [Cytobacillus firmus]|uniref:hypothetical protein n=1 Tax=Cytobacillus firmus TaxID=1399 RepID=UPI001C8DFA06|nr:hypothetical protein [Cytobacillus firmus]MBX9976586.1 hypothetical protein [Cytobacillus firmus]